MPSKKYLDQTGLAHFWDKITDYVGDASKVMIVNITYNETDDVYESDKTVSEIKSAKDNGYAIFAVYGGSIYTLTRSTNSRAIFDTNVLSVDAEDLVMAEGYSIIIYGENSEVEIEQPVSVHIPLGATSTETPLMDGTASAGSSLSYARADHVHPSDTTKANVSDVLTKTNTTSYTPSADYHPATKKYVDDSISGFSSSLSGLTDTTISLPTNGQVLSYDTSTSKWKNATIPTGATYTLSMTNNVITLTGSNGSTSSVTLPVYGGEVDEVLG